MGMLIFNVVCNVIKGVTESLISLYKKVKLFLIRKCMKKVEITDFRMRIEENVKK